MFESLLAPMRMENMIIDTINNGIDCLEFKLHFKSDQQTTHPYKNYQPSVPTLSTQRTALISSFDEEDHCDAGEDADTQNRRHSTRNSRAHECWTINTQHTSAHSWVIKKGISISS